MLCLRSFSLLAWCCLCFITPVARADQTNVTIDDTYGDIETRALPVYSSNGWSVGQNCPGCSAQPNASQAFKGSWHDATHHPEDPDPERTVNLTFKGVAVYVYFILGNNIGSEVASNTFLAFILDGEPVGQFNHTATSSPDYQYNVSVYSNSSIPVLPESPNGQHTLSITSAGNTPDSLLLFDYAIYTYASYGLILDLRLFATSADIAIVPSFDTALNDQPSTLPQSSSTSTTETSTLSNSASSSATSLPDPTSTSKPHSSGAVLGAIIGGVGGAIILIALLVFYLRRRLTAQRRLNATPHPSTVEKGPAFIEPFIAWNPRARHRASMPDSTTTSSATPLEERRQGQGRTRDPSRRTGRPDPVRAMSDRIPGRTGGTSSGSSRRTTTTGTQSGVEDVRRQMADMRAEMHALRMLHLARREEAGGDDDDDEPPPEYEEEA